MEIVDPKVVKGAF